MRNVALLLIIYINDFVSYGYTISSAYYRQPASHLAQNSKSGFFCPVDLDIPDDLELWILPLNS